MKFRKKPVVIEAMQLTENNYMAIKKWINGTENAFPAYLGSGNISIGIHTLEGEMRADLGDWIIKGVEGEFYPITNDIFELTYEPAGQ